MSKKQIEEFKKNWISSNKREKKSEYKIEDTSTLNSFKGVSICVYSAYSDAKRKFKYKKNIEELERLEMRNNALINLQRKLIRYLRSGDPNKYKFEEWSKKLIVDFNKCCDNMTYGKAQKIINMSFKYFYCCIDKPDDKMFYPCHMALDTFTLDWYKDISKINIIGWSNINDFDFYINIQNHIKEYLKKQKKYPLMEEFSIWDKQTKKYSVFEVTQKTKEDEYKKFSKQILEKIQNL